MYIVRALKRNKDKLSDEEQAYSLSNKILIFVTVLVAIIFTVDYALVVNFIEILKKL